MRSLRKFRASLYRRTPPDSVAAMEGQKARAIDLSRAKSYSGIVTARPRNGVGVLIPQGRVLVTICFMWNQYGILFFGTYPAVKR